MKETQMSSDVHDPGGKRAKCKYCSKENLVVTRKMSRQTNNGKGKRTMIYSEANGWSDLSKDLLQDISKRLDPTYLLRIISLICRVWQVTSFDILFHAVQCNNRLLDLDKLRLLCARVIVKENINKVELALSRLIGNQIDSNGDMFKDTTRPSNFIGFLLQVSDQHHGAERTCKIMGVYLKIRSITYEDLSRAIPTWRVLEMISIVRGRVVNYPGMFCEIGVNCEKFTSSG